MSECVIKIEKIGALLRISPADKIYGHLVTDLQYIKTTQLYGKERYGKKIKGSKPITSQRICLYHMEDNFLFTMSGFLTRIVKKLRGLGLRVETVDLAPLKLFEPRFDLVEDFKFRDVQLKMLEIMLTCDRAQLNGCTAVGKTTLITQYLRMFPQREATFLVVAPSIAIVNAFYESIRKYYPKETGKLGGGRHTLGRIIVSTSRSMHHVSPDVWTIIYDEVHTAGAKNTSDTIIRCFPNSRMLGFSATTNMRTDKSDLLVEGIFGPVRCNVSYSEAKNKGYVADVRAYFYNVTIAQEASDDRVIRNKRCVWRNVPLNTAVSKAARFWAKQFDYDPQIIILVGSVEHGLFLQRMLPEYQLLYASMSQDQITKFKRHKLLSDDFKPIKPSEYAELINKVCDGSVKRVISTSLIGTGVDTKNLDVFIRADCGASAIGNVQYRGRVTRGSSGVYVDFMVNGDHIENGRSKSRHKSCLNDGWKTNVSDVPEEI